MNFLMDLVKCQLDGGHLRKSSLIVMILITEVGRRPGAYYMCILHVTVLSPTTSCVTMTSRCHFGVFWCSEMFILSEL